jgi:TPR repeat protein
VWYWQNKDGSYEFYDCPGYYTRTGQELAIITQEIADEYLGKRAVRAPNPIDISKYNPFDPNTGVARVWYWRSENSTYEFYDGPGFHPRNGEPLKLFTKEAMQNWEHELKQEKDRLDKENKKRADDEEKRKRDLAKKEEADKAECDEVRKRLTEAAGLCDDLAANPSDTNRVGEGVPFDALKARAQEAVSNCETAVSQKPGELRFKYQLARALHWTNRKRAFDILQELVGQRYPAAFDNLGWLYLTERKDTDKAIALFRSGAQTGDSDSMLSLAEMIDRGHLVVANPAGEKLALYQRAAQLGNKTAITAYQNVLAEIQNAEQARVLQLQQQQMMLQILGGVLRH